MFEINTLKFVKLQSFIQKEAKPEPKIPYFGIFRSESKKTIVTFEISAFEFVRMQSFMLKKIF